MYNYKLIQVDFNGNKKDYSAEAVFVNIAPVEFLLDQNYPNPFNPNTTIRFSIPRSGLVTLKVFDIMGKEVAALVNEAKAPGNYEVEWNASNLPSGVYFYKLLSGNYSSTRKMTLMK